MAGLSTTLLATACLLVLVSVIQPIARRLVLPETVLLAVIGILLGGGTDFLLQSPEIHAFDRAAEVLANFPLDSEGVLTIFLPILVFAGSLSIDVRRLARDGTTVLVLAVVAVVISTAMIGLAIYPFTKVGLPICLMLGAIVANTDPSAVTAIFRDIGAASRLTRLVEGEALLNDAAAISIFGLLVDAIVSHRGIAFGDIALRFAISFAGAIVIGIALARAALAMISLVAETTAGEVTLTLALPFIAYILCEHYLNLSGVVAVAAAGLTLSSRGQSTMRPQNWRFLTELWEQLAFWAGSLVFVLASMLVPRLLFGATLHDVGLVLLAVLAALIARALVIFGLLPLLAAARLSRPVPNPYRVTILWGGLRGAITLALALSVTENPAIPSPVAHFVGVVATGFVLFTLLVNGTTLRALVVFLGLDRLSARDEALRRQVLAIGLGEVHDQARDLADELGFRTHVSRDVLDGLQARIDAEQEANDFDNAIGDSDRIVLGLITIAARERSLLIDLFRNGTLPRGVLERLLRTADLMVDGARYEGRLGYIRATRRRLQPDLRFRVAQWLHQTFRIDRPLMIVMTERYEIILVSQLLARALSGFMNRRVEPVLGARVAQIVAEVLERRERLLGDALEAMRLHYQNYAEALEGRVLRRAALRIEVEEYDGMEAENLIGEELHLELVRDVERRRRPLLRRLRFNVQAGIDNRIRSFVLFEGVPDAALSDLSAKLSMRFAVPGERLIARNQRPRAVYLVSSGLLEHRIGESEENFVPGEQVGAAEILSGERVRSTVRCAAYSHLLVIGLRDFRRLVREFPAVRENVERLHHGRRSRLGDDATPAHGPTLAIGAGAG